VAKTVLSPFILSFWWCPYCSARGQWFIRQVSSDTAFSRASTFWSGWCCCSSLL